MPKEKWKESSHHILEQATGLEGYNRWLMSHFQPYFGKSIIEIGSGQGALSRLLPHTSIIVLTDIVAEYLRKLQNIFTDPVINLDIENEAPKNLQGRFDTVFSSNVFEHIEDDLSAFKNAYKLLEPGGRLLLFVPARPEIYGKLDKDMDHFRRYTKKDLSEKARKAGFKMTKVYYANLPGYFTWWGRGVLLGSLIKQKSGTGKLDAIFASIFDKFIVPLLYLEKYIHPPFGQSLVLIAEKTVDSKENPK